MKERFIEAGEVVNTHGVRGEVKIIPWTDSAEFLAAIRTLYIDGRAVKVRAARVHKGTVLAALEGVEDVNAAMRLKGRRVFIDRADAKLPKGGYFISLYVMPGCAKRVAGLCKDAGLTLTGAGSAYPYHKDPQDSHLRIAPTYPSLDEVETASDLLCVCVKLAVIEKLLAEKAE